MGSRTSGRGRYKANPDAVSRNVQDQKSRQNIYGYLNTPEEIPTLKIEKEGSIYLDILPYIVSDENHIDRNDEFEIAVPDTPWYKKPFYLYRSIGLDYKSVISPRTVGKPCPIEEYQRQMKRDGVDSEIIKKLYPSLRNLYVVIPRGLSKHDEVPHIWDISQSCFQKLLNQEILERDKYSNFYDPDDGYTLKVRFDQRKLGRNYFFESSRIDFEDREVEITDDELESVPDLDAILQIIAYEELKTIFEELPPEAQYKKGRDDDDDDDEDRDRGRGRGRRDDDDDDDEDRDRGRGRGRRDRGGDDDDDDDDDDRDRDRGRGRGRGRRDRRRD